MKKSGFEPTFRIPDYIALRFNLQITHVHKGLLLGTGPLIDPGFEGKLLIPLHNFTLNKYTLYGGQDLVWIEFTKLSPFEDWNKCIEENPYKNIKGFYAKFPTSKKINKALNFIEKAVKDVKDPNNEVCVRNAIPEDLREIRERTEKASKKVDKLTKYAILTLIIAAFAAIWPIFSLVQDSTNYVQNAKKDMENKIQLYERLINKQNITIEEQNKKLDNFEREIEEVKNANYQNE